MENRSKRWPVLIILGFSCLAFISLSLIPILGGLFNSSESVNGNPALTASAEQTRLEEEERGYQLVVDREPENQTALQGLFETRAKLIQLGARQPKDLIDPLSRLKDLNPDQPDYAVLLAQTHQQAGDREAAATAYREVLDRQPGNTNALQGLVALFLAENRASAAEELLQSTLAAAKATAEPAVDTTAVQLILGDVYIEQQKYSEALAIYNSLIQLDGQDFRPLVGKAVALRAQGNEAEAKPLFASAEKIAPAQFKDQIRQLASQPGQSELSPRPAAP
ncbi:tetratricopeptide repeat protein [Lyngbya confervoides]|uniref:Tetratricopeptide repeat protein n=1 Tax=Lyngbya confervoides BDU141951 TaxID=1574623 RepID=A0ABD4T4X8_9CYAN|nr:tetratricopeptide repeat protein [Lyngbya confervoides]MCM1983520.1 tetratricopeptide repeat protein [Lyngbya confervoides BDU141951]